MASTTIISQWQGDGLDIATAYQGVVNSAYPLTSYQQTTPGEAAPPGASFDPSKAAFLQVNVTGSSGTIATLNADPAFNQAAAPGIGNAFASGGQNTIKPLYPSGITAVNVYRSQVSGGQTNRIASGAAGSQFTDHFVVSGTYYYTITAVNSSGGESAMSVEAAITVAGGPAPGTPTGLSVTGQTTTTMDLSWSSGGDGGGVTTYSIYQGASSGAEIPVAVMTGISGTTATITGLTTGTTYYFKVQAVDNFSGNSDLSSEASGTTS